jgi:hypothetical protein
MSGGWGIRDRDARYGPGFRAAKRAWAAKVRAGGVPCWRCGSLLDPGGWHLGHVDGTGMLHPEHKLCNEDAARAASRESRRVNEAKLRRPRPGHPGLG